MNPSPTMSVAEFIRLRTWENNVHRHRSYNRSIKSKRSVKGNAKGYGSILKHSRVHTQVSVERDFNPPAWRNL